jgi:ubiquinone/menaquinone biosynthesis C-methylase UbiE
VGIGVKLCKSLNSIFPLPSHPFNSDGGPLAYGEWQYERGRDTLRFFLPFASVEEMFAQKTALDVGCGAAGKTLYYASQGVERIYGLEILEKYRADAEALAEKHGLSGRFSFLQADAAGIPLPDASIDTVIMNDAFEHVPEPEAVLTECLRVLKPTGRLYMNFPPYHHPFGAHLSDAVGIPWVHLLFSDATLIKVYRDAVSGLPDGDERVAFRISRDGDGREYFSYINKMTVKRAARIVKALGITPLYHYETPLRPFLTPLAKLPGIKEAFVKMVTYIIGKG